MILGLFPPTLNPYICLISSQQQYSCCFRQPTHPREQPCAPQMPPSFSLRHLFAPTPGEELGKGRSKFDGQMYEPLEKLNAL